MTPFSSPDFRLLSRPGLTCDGWKEVWLMGLLTNERLRGESERVRSDHRQVVPHCGIPGSCMGISLEGRPESLCSFEVNVGAVALHVALGILMQALFVLPCRRLYYTVIHISVQFCLNLREGVLLLRRRINGPRGTSASVPVKPFKRRNYCRP
jgi:hypothetical protein